MYTGPLTVPANWCVCPGGTMGLFVSSCANALFPAAFAAAICWYRACFVKNATAFHRELKYCSVADPCSEFAPDFVDIEMLSPVECPKDASKFDVSILNSSITSGLGMYDVRRSVPFVDAPSSDHSLPPTPPGIR